MQFKKEVQDLFKKAGWFPGRNVQHLFDAIPRFNEYPTFAKEFLYEYGGLKVHTATYTAERDCPIMDFTLILWEGATFMPYYLDEPRYYGNIITYPLADYPTDPAFLQCDAQGKVYMAGDFPGLMSNDFKTGIEKALMEDYFDTLKWDDETNQWLADD